MGKQPSKSWTPPDDDIIVEDTVEQKPVVKTDPKPAAAAWTPPEDDAIVQPVKKKDQAAIGKKNQSAQSGQGSSGLAEQRPQPSSGNGASKWGAISTALETVNPAAKIGYDFGRRVISGFTDDVPKSTAQALEVGKTFLAPTSVEEFVKTQKPIDFQKYVREKEGMKWYSGFTVDEHLEKYARQFMIDKGYADKIPVVEARSEEATQRRLGVEKFVQEQNEDAATKMAGAVQDFREIKSLTDLGSYIATMGGQAAYQIPLSVLTKGQSSLLQESAAIYDTQLTNLAKMHNISREEVIKRKLDDPAAGQAYAVLAASLDAASAGNILSAFKKGAEQKLLSKWASSALPEMVTEAGQGVLEQVGGAPEGHRLEALNEAIKDPDRINEALGGLIGGSAGVFGPSAKQTTEVLTNDVDPTNHESLTAKAEVIQNAVENHEQDLAQGNPDAQNPVETNGQKTQTESVERVLQPKVEPTISEAEKEEVASEETTEEAKGVDERDKRMKQLMEIVANPNLDAETVNAAQQELSTLSRTPANDTLYDESQNTPDQAQRDDAGTATSSEQDTTQMDSPQSATEVQQVEGDTSSQQSTDESVQNNQTQNVNQDAVQEQSSNALDVRQQTADGQGVGSGNTEQQVSSGEEEQVQNESENQNERLNNGNGSNNPRTPDSRSNDSGGNTPVVAGSVGEGAEGGQGVATPPGNENKAGQEQADSPIERKTWRRIKDDKDISSEIKDGISAEAKKYVPRSLKKVTEKEAKAIIEAKGDEESVKMYLDNDSGIHPDVETAIGIELFDKLQKAGQFDDAIRVFEKLATRGTELGQAVNAYKLLQGKTMLHVVDKSIKQRRKRYKEQNAFRGQDAKEAVDKINTEAVEKVLKSEEVQKKIKQSAKEGGVKKAIDFLESLKVDTKGKALDVTYGLTVAAWNTVITTVQKGLKAGLTISQAINKAVNAVTDKNFRKQEAIDFLDKTLASYRVTLDPVRAIKAELQAQNKTVDDIIREHYTSQASTKKQLVDKLINDGNIPAEQAQEVADAIAQKFDEITRDAKAKALKKVLKGTLATVKKTSPKEKSFIDKMIELSNMGALSEDQYLEAMAKQLGVEDLTAEQAKEVQDLTEKIQNAKGDTQKSKAAQNLFNYIETQKGISAADVAWSVWYANILSGPSTWLVNNPFANLTNLLAEVSIDIARYPKDAGFVLARVASGLVRGLAQARDVLKTGYDPYKGENYKTEATPVLERKKFIGGKINPLNWLKYVTRAMKAGDIIFYQGLREQRMAVLALNEARKFGKTKPTQATNNSLYQHMMQEDFQNAKDQAASEGFTGNDATIRAYEILEESRPEMAIKDADTFAARATFNMKPEGALGRVAESLNSFRRNVPGAKIILPFVNTIINVANEYLNYTPVGAWRAMSGSMGLSKESPTYKVLSREERQRIAVKTAIGAVAAAALFALDDPEDEDSMFEITANGTGDIKKNYELARSGWHPYSVRIGKTWYNYKNTPLAIIFASIGYLKDSQRYIKKDPSAVEKAEIMAFGTLQFFQNMSSLSALSDFFEMFNKSNIAEATQSADNFFKYWAKAGKSLIIPNYFTQVSRLQQEISDTPMKKAPDMVDQLIRDVPVIKDHLHNMYDAFGDPVVPKQMEKFLPFNAARSPEDKEMFDFLKKHKLFVGVASKATLKPNGEAMTEDEYDKFALESARAIKKRILKGYKRYSREKNEAVIADWFNDVKREERKDTRRRLFRSF